ncbi:hypothetical protein CGLAMM_07270 [Acetobacteraceae bacterium EV16G]|uniref:Uncharacterized protein n=1 Tax=Sorlinia euscelidii TaxID=3081148 RepID=A0ABU7U306_9PROT
MAITGPTSGYAAGEQTNLTHIEYAQELNFATSPKTGFMRLRHAGETLAVQDMTATPDEINAIPEDAETILTGRSVSGSISGLLSYSTYDDFIAAVMGMEWADGMEYVCSDPAHCPAMWMDNGVFHLETFEDNPKLLDWPVAGMMRLTNPQNVSIDVPFINRSLDPSDSRRDIVTYSNMAGRAIYAKLFATSAVTDRVIIPEGFKFTPLGASNHKVGKTFTFRKRVADRYQIFTGNMVSQIQIHFQAQQTPTVQMDFIGANLVLSSAPVTDSVLPATTTRIMEAARFRSFSIDGTSYDGMVQSVNLTLTRNGAAQDQALGKLGAAGIQFGAFKASLEAEVYFRDYAVIDLWQSGRKVQISFSIVDDAGKGYVFTLLNAQLFNFTAPIDQKNKTMVLRLPFTGNPYPGGGTLAVRRIG